MFNNTFSNRFILLFDHEINKEDIPMNEKRHSPWIPILLLFFGVLLGAVIFKSEMMYVQGEEHKMKCCGEDKDRIRHFGCGETSKETYSPEKDI